MFSKHMVSLLWGILTRVKRQMRLVEQELITVQILVSLCCTIFGYLCSILSLITCLFVLFFVAFVRLIFTVSRYPFGIFKPFLSQDLCFKRCSVRQLFVIWFVYEVKIISVFISVLKIPLYCLPFRSIWGHRFLVGFVFDL